MKKGLLIFALVGFHFDDFTTRTWPMIQSWEKVLWREKDDFHIVFTGYMKHDLWWKMIEEHCEKVFGEMSIDFFKLNENKGKAFAVNQAYEKVSQQNNFSFIFISDGDMRVEKETLNELFRCWDQYEKLNPFQMLGYIVVTQTGDDRVFCEVENETEDWIVVDHIAPAGGALLISKTMFEAVDMFQIKDEKNPMEDVVLFQNVKSLGAVVLISKKAICFHPFFKKHIVEKIPENLPLKQPQSRAEIMMQNRRKRG